MEPESSTFGLKPQRLARLLGVAADDLTGEDQARQDEEIAALLAGLLAGAVPLDSVAGGWSPNILQRLRRELLPLADSTLDQVLLDPAGDVRLVRTVKDYGKKLSMARGTEAEHAVAVALYYAAIASALVFHDQKISKHSYGRLDESFAKLIERPWLAAPVAELLERARALCQERARTRKNPP